MKTFFSMLHGSSSGTIKKEEFRTLAAALGILLDNEELNELFDELDKDKDEHVSLQECEEWWAGKVSGFKCQSFVWDPDNCFGERLTLFMVTICVIPLSIVNSINTTQFLSKKKN